MAVSHSFFGMKNQIVLLFYTNLSIRSHLEYAACGILIISNQLENWKKVQKHAAKLVLTVKKKLCYEERLRKLKLPTLKYRRIRGDD